MLDMGGAPGVQQYGDAGELWDGFLEEAQTLSRHLRPRLREASHIPARVRTAGSEPTRHGVGRCAEDNGNRLRCLFGSSRRLISRREDGIDTKAHEFRRQLRQSFIPLLCELPFNNRGLAVNVTKLAKPRSKRIEQI